MKTQKCLFCNQYVMISDIKLRRVLNNKPTESFIYSCSKCYNKEVML